ncbi:MAG TPA: C4-type zinc ribbon domain-containing protein [Vicinamibacteria bacterium]|nr:C4-type zinc ribbon domain-containing protein [Vicinamibacteria bacterium]
MNPDLAGLIRLQRADSELRRVEAELAQVPRRRAELEASLAAERGRLEAARGSLEVAQKSRRRFEGELQDLESKRSKYKGQLMEVKTNKEYTAMLHEIEGVEREIRAREDQVLAEMERAETLTADIKREEALFKSSEEEHRTRERALGEEEARQREQARRLSGERDAEAGRLPGAVLELFQRVARLRGVAVAEARDGMCQVCHLKLRLQMYADLKRNEEIVQCPACNRILYFEPPPPVSSPTP